MSQQTRVSDGRRQDPPRDEHSGGILSTAGGHLYRSYTPHRARSAYWPSQSTDEAGLGTSLTRQAHILHAEMPIPKNETGVVTNHTHRYIEARIKDLLLNMKRRRTYRRDFEDGGLLWSHAGGLLLCLLWSFRHGRYRYCICTGKRVWKL